MRAWLRIFEVVLASLFLVTFLHFAQNLAFSQVDINQGIAETKVMSQQVLSVLDNIPSGSQSVLESAVANGNYEFLNRKTAEILPQSYKFAYRIGNHADPLPEISNVGYTSYFVTYKSGGSVVTKKIILYVWRAL